MSQTEKDKKQQEFEKLSSILNDANYVRSGSEIRNDIWQSLKSGTVSAVQSGIGLTDLMSGGHTGKFIQDNIWDTHKTQENIQSQMSDTAKMQKGQFERAEGFGGKLGVVLDNPMLALDGMVQSSPSMVTSGLMGRGIGKLAGINNGVVRSAGGASLEMAGNSAENLRSQNKDGLMTGKDYAAAVGTGVGGAAITYLGGRISKGLGVADVDTMVAGGVRSTINEAKQNATKGGIGYGLAGIGKGAISEGVFEELPQTILETGLENWAKGRDLTENMAGNAVMGLTSGAGMGGVAGVVSSNWRKPPTPDTGTTNNQTDSTPQPPDNGGNTPLSPDGSPISPTSPNNPSSPNSPDDGNGGAYFDTPHNENQTVGFHGNPLIDTPATGLQNLIEHTPLDTQAEQTDTTAPQAEPVSQVGQTERAMPDVPQTANSQDMANEPTPQNAPLADVNPQTFANPQHFNGWLNQDGFVNQYKAQQELNAQKPSEQLGLDPNQGSLTRSAVVAVDSGATQAINPQGKLARASEPLSAYQTQLQERTAQQEAQAQEARAVFANAPKLIGKQNYIQNQNERLPTQIMVVEADSLMPSVDNTTNQARDRSRATSRVQVDNIANNLDPMQLTDSTVMGHGSPTISHDGTIIAGNGRTMAIKQAYLQGKADEYRQMLMERADEYGLDKTALAGMKNPVLVKSVGNVGVDKLRQLALNSNETGTMTQSAFENARADVERVANINLNQLHADERGDINTSSNRHIINEFVSQFPIEQQNAMRTSDGVLSKQGLERFENALLLSAYGDNPTTQAILESTDEQVRNAVKAIVATAPAVAKTKQSIQDGIAPDDDIASDITEALSMLAKLRREGVKPSDYLAQTNLFGDELSPTGQRLLAFMDENIRSVVKIRQLLYKYYDNLSQENLKQDDMFGKETQTKSSRLNQALQELGHDQFVQPITATATATAEQAKPTSQATQINERPEKSVSDGQGVRRDDEQVNPNAKSKPQNLSQEKQDYFPNKFANAINENTLKSMNGEQLQAISDMLSGRYVDASVFDNIDNKADKSDNQSSNAQKENPNANQPRNSQTSDRVLADRASDSVATDDTRATTSVHSKTGGTSAGRNSNQSETSDDRQRSPSVQPDGTQTSVSERVNADFASYVKNHDTLAKATKAYFDDHLKGKTFDTVIGKVHVLGSSWQKKLKAGISNQKVDEVKAFAIPFISDILTNGHYDGVWGANKERKDAYVRFHSFSKEVSIRNKPTFVRVLVGERENNEFELVVYNLYPNKKSDDNSITLIGEPSDFDESIANSNQENKSKETPNSSGLSEVTKALLGDGNSLAKSDNDVSTQATAQALQNAIQTANQADFALSDEMVQTSVSERVNADFASYVKNHDTLAKATKAYFDDHLKGKTFDTVIGKVHVLGSSWQKKLKAGIHKDENQAKAISFIPEILTTGTYDGKELANKVRKDDFIAFHSFSKEVQIDGNDVFVRLLVGERENNEFEFVVYAIYPNKKSSDESDPRSTWSLSKLLPSIANSEQENKSKETPNSSGLSEVTKALLGDGNSLAKSDNDVSTQATAQALPKVLQDKKGNPKQVIGNRNAKRLLGENGLVDDFDVVKLDNGKYSFVPKENKPFVEPSQDEINEFIDKALNGNIKNELTLFPAGQKEIDIAKQSGVDIAGMYHTLKAENLRHAINSHGQDDSRTDGKRSQQRSLTVDDLKKIPDVLKNFDELTVQKRKENQSSLVYKKQMADGTIEYVERVIETSRENKPRLLSQTVWVGWRATGVISPRPPQVYTPDTPSTTEVASDDSITNSDKAVKQDLTPSQQSALNALEKLPDSDPKKAEFMDAIYGVGTTDSEQDKKARRELVGRITTYEMVKRNANKLADELSELGYDVKVADSTLFDNTKEVATQLTAKKSGKTLNVMVNKTLPQGRSNDSVRDGFFVKDGNVSYRIDFNELNIAQRIDNHTDYVSNKEYFGANRPVYRQNAKPTDWQQRMAGQMARLFDDDPALPQFIELANQRNLSTGHKNSLIGSITSYADVQFKKGNALQKDDVIGKNNDEYHQGKIKFSRMGDVVAPVDEQAKVLQGKAVSVIDESTLDMPKVKGFKAIEKWATNLFEKQGGKAINPTLGEIILNHRSVKDSLAHGKFSPYKNIAFAGVKDVLEKGVIVAVDTIQKSQDSFYISAPVLMNGKENILTVIVHRDVNTQSMYLHSVMTKENLMKPRVSETQEQNSRKHIGSLTSSDIHNILQNALTYKEKSKKELIVTHNISADGIIHADKMGGLPFASIAITKQSNPLDGFGEVTLIGDSHMIDPKGANKAKVFGSDIYSPRYPKVIAKVDRKKLDEINNRLQQSNEFLGYGNTVIADDFSQRGNPFNTPQAKHYFLSKNGINVEKQYINQEQKQTGNHEMVAEKQAMIEAVAVFDDVFGGNAKAFLATASQDDIKTVLQQLSNNDIVRFEELFDAIGQVQIDRTPLKARVKATLDTIKGNEIKMNDFLLNHLNKMAAVASGRVKASDGKTIIKQVYSFNETTKAIDKAIKDNELEQAFDDYIDDLKSQLILDERLENGSRTLPHTLENVVKKLKKDLRGGESMNYGLPNLRAKITPQFKSIKDIQDNKDRLLTKDDFSAIKQEVEQSADHLAKKLGISELDIFDFLHDVIDSSVGNALKTHQAFTSQDNINAINEFLAKLKAMPTEYFEVKAKDVTQFGDFKGAVVPNDLPQKARQILENSGLKIYPYANAKDRANVIKQATWELDESVGDVLFQKQGGRYGTTAQDVLDVLNNRFGKGIIKKLMNNGSLNIISLAEAKAQFGNIPDDVDGFYTDGTAYLVHDNIHPDMIVPTFLHELGGHGGLQTLMSEKAYQSLLNEFHDMVARGDETAKQAKALADKHSRTQAEADSEYLAYMITLASRNNSSKAKSLMNRVIMAIKTFLKNTFGISLALTPNDILALSEKMVRDRANGQMGNGVDDVWFSLDESENSDFARAVDEIVAGKRKKGFVRLGKTPDVLKMLGVIDGTVRISRDVLEKSMANVLKRRTYFRHTHSVTPEMMKELPKQLNNPIAVFKSSSVDGAMVVLTELTEHSKGKDKPVVATLHFETTKKGVELVNIASVYGRSKSQLKTAFNDDLLYLHKEKGQQFLTTMELQLHQDFTSKNADLSTHNIKTNDDLSQYQNENNNEQVGNAVDDVRFSYTDSKQTRLEKLKNSKPIEITGNEIELSDDIKQLKRNAFEYGKKLRGRYTNQDTGREIEVNRPSLVEILKHDYKNVEHLQSVAAIPQIIEKSIYIETLPNEDKAKNPHIKEYEYYLAGLKIDGVDYTVKAVIGVSDMGDKYYDHKLTNIEKGDLLEACHTVIKSGVPQQKSPLDIDDKRLLQILQEKNDNLDIQFSRMADMADFYDKNQDKAKEVLGKLGGVVNDFINNPKSFVKSAKNGAKQGMGDKFKDYLGYLLGILNEQQLVELYGKKLKGLQTYRRIVQQMDADSNENAFRADKLAVKWGKLKDEQALAELMHDVTQKGIDPSRAYQTGDKAQYQRLKRAYDKLSDDAKAVYEQARDDYQDYYKNLHEAMTGRIKRNAKLSSERKQKLLDELDKQYQATRQVFFPLTRFGDYVVVVRDTDGNVVNVARAETKAKADEIRRGLIRDNPNYQVGQVVLGRDMDIRKLGGVQGLASEFLTDELDLGDELHQAYLNSLLDRQFANNNVELKGTAGFSTNARRAYAHHMRDGGYHIAKLRHTDRLRAELDRMQQHIDDNVDNPDYDHVTMQRVVDEMEKRHKILLNPPTNPLSTMATSVGFMWYMGLSPASALVNISQTLLLAYPMMGAKWGFSKAQKELTQASKDWWRIASWREEDGTISWQSLTHADHMKHAKKVLSAKEYDAVDKAFNRGTIDKTQAHDLAGIANGEDSKVSQMMKPAMKVASVMFHEAEVYNRQATFLASYRLARGAGIDHETAIIMAGDMTRKAHFDYSQSNRARYMNTPVAKVVLLFKQYSQNMIFTLIRQTALAMPALGKFLHNRFSKNKRAYTQEELEAAKAISAIFAGHALFAGALGLPSAIVTPFLAAATMLGMGGDDDDDWGDRISNGVATLFGSEKAEVAFRNALADVVGNDVAEVVAKGVPRAVGVDLSTRVGLNNLIVPHTQDGLEGQSKWENFMTAMLGPVVGIGGGVVKGWGEFFEGHELRGIETASPKFFKDYLKAYRYATEGHTTKDGKEIVERENVGAWDSGLQAIGFRSAKFAQVQEARSAMFGADKELTATRKRLINRYALAKRDGDDEQMDRIWEEIKRFNVKYPSNKITKPALMQSIRQRQRRIDNAKDGIYLSKNREHLREYGAFGVGG